MSGIPGTEDDLAAIREAFAEDVTYSGAGLDGETVSAVVTDATEDGFQRKSFEIAFAGLPEDPEKDDRITDGDGAVWSVIDFDRRLDVGAWVIFVESV